MNRSKKRILKSYLLLLGGSLIPFFLFISFLYQLNISENISEMKSEKKMILNLIKKDIEKEFVDSIDDVQFLSKTPQLRSLLYEKSNLEENRGYLKSYLKIKNKYFGGYIKSNKNSVIIEGYYDNEYLKFPKQLLTKNSEKITFSKIGNYKNNFIVNITAPIYGKDDLPLGVISFYGKQAYIDNILKKYRSTDLLSEGDFYWFTLDNNNEIEEAKKIEVLKKGNVLPINSNSGSIFSKNVLFVFETIDLKEILPQAEFKIFISVREHLSYGKSYYQQKAKLGRLVTNDMMADDIPTLIKAENNRLGSYDISGLNIVES
jgi:hypothetical protein